MAEWKVIDLIHDHNSTSVTDGKREYKRSVTVTIQRTSKRFIKAPEIGHLLRLVRRG